MHPLLDTFSFSFPFLSFPFRQINTYDSGLASYSVKSKHATFDNITNASVLHRVRDWDKGIENAPGNLHYVSKRSHMMEITLYTFIEESVHEGCDES